MKKVLLFSLVTLMATSCTTVRKTATAVDVNTSLKSYDIAELDISPKRVTYEFRPSKQERRGGKNNVINCAYAAALAAHDNADILVQPEYSMRIRNGLFSRNKIKRITVTGYPAKIKKFKSAK